MAGAQVAAASFIEDAAGDSAENAAMAAAFADMVVAVAGDMGAAQQEGLISELPDARIVVFGYLPSGMFRLQPVTGDGWAAADWPCLEALSAAQLQLLRLARSDPRACMLAVTYLDRAARNWAEPGPGGRLLSGYLLKARAGSDIAAAIRRKQGRPRA